MITLFSVLKPFRGHIKVIQMNAVQSWARLFPRCEIILFGGEEGVAEAASCVGARHVSDVSRNEYGTPLLDDVFSKAQAAARYDMMCYVNADIVLSSCIVRAVESVRKKRNTFLMVGKRWNMNLEQSIDFSGPGWEEQFRAQARRSGNPSSPEWIDYFVFPRGFYCGLLPFALGRAAFDNWLLWKARSLGAPIIDASKVVTVVHQNHDYLHHPEGQKGVWLGAEARRNRELMGGGHRCFTLSDATHKLSTAGLKPNLSLERIWRLIWIRSRVRFLHWLFVKTIPLWHRLGLFKSRGRF